MANDGTKGDELLEHLGIPKHNYFFPMNGFDANKMPISSKTLSCNKKKNSSFE